MTPASHPLCTKGILNSKHRDIESQAEKEEKDRNIISSYNI